MVFMFIKLNANNVTWMNHNSGTFFPGFYLFWIPCTEFEAGWECCNSSNERWHTQSRNNRYRPARQSDRPSNKHLFKVNGSIQKFIVNWLLVIHVRISWKSVSISTVCVKDCGLHSQKNRNHNFLTCLVGHLNFSHVEIQKKI